MSKKLEQTTILGASVVASGALAVGLGLAYLAFGSELALAQTADSVADVVAALGLMWAMRISRAPPDANHPFGHQGAQPIAALIVAVLACVLAIEVLREAVGALIARDAPVVTTGLLAALGGKAVLKVGFAWLARSGHQSPALTAFYVDARNDAVIGFASVLGLVCSSTLGLPMLDAWLAIPVALWVGWSGISLGMENADLLMGATADPHRVAELRELTADVPQVQSVHAILGRRHGEDIHVWLEIRVNAELTVRNAHDIGDEVERRLLDEADVCRVDVHIDAG